MYAKITTCDIGSNLVVIFSPFPKQRQVTREEKTAETGVWEQEEESTGATSKGRLLFYNSVLWLAGLFLAAIPITSVCPSYNMSALPITSVCPSYDVCPFCDIRLPFL